jgi:hypothetical protein
MSEEYTAGMDVMDAITQLVDDAGIETGDIEDQKNFLSNLTSTQNEMVDVQGRQMPVEMKDDFDLARENLRTILEKGMKSISDMVELAKDSQHPKVYDTLTIMMKTVGDLNTQLIELNKEKHKIRQDLEPSLIRPTVDGGAGVTNNTIFVGSTKDLQEFFKKKVT